ncbi:MAG: SusD/RagB family nutrient-binding outer membrane lipoprotein [Bacteroidetes bacterium]|nr:SusD/RagB family nutrient-binding outer membrane lipoprotein [Bacteroidota bacterium]
MRKLSKSRLNFCIIIAIVLFTSCTKNFEEYNTNTSGLSEKQIAADYQNLGEPMKQAQQNIISYTDWIMQLEQNLIGDIYSGYMMSATPFEGNSNNMTYDLVDGWNYYEWDYVYDNVMKPTQNVLEATTEPQNASFHAWAKIVRVEAMHRASDIYGPIIYSNYGKSNQDGSVTFDSQKEAYYAFFIDLDSAINVLTPLVQNSAPSTFSKFDLVYGGSFEKWLKFANTLRLRLAIRISKSDPAKAKSEGEAALSNPGGLLATNDENAFVDIGTNYHPLNGISSWGDINIGAPLACYLNGYNDPRVSKYMQAATDPAVAGQNIGIRSGIDIDANGRYVGYSRLQEFPNKIQLIVAAEAWFLKAEAALKGWAAAGDAKTNYENGISTSFAQYGLNATSYITNNTGKEQQYIDPKAITPGQNDVLTGSPYLSTITISWNDGDTPERKLERVITQKWLALFPDGQEAWSEFRRTGYPKLFPVVLNKSGGKISTTDFVQRINFPSTEIDRNASGVAAAVGMLDGPDTGGTPLWWAK